MRRPLFRALLFVSTSLAGAAIGEVTALRVGTLIDGHGGEPVGEAVVLIEGERIVAAGSGGEVPAGSPPGR